MKVNATELAVLEQLHSGPVSIGDLCAVTGRSMTTVYRALANLRRRGHRIYRRGDPHHIVFELV